MRRFGTYALLCIGLLAVAAGLWKAREDRFLPLEHLPLTDATVVSLDVSTLRHTGILSMLAGKPEAEEPEYLSFIRATGFDYQKDLDSVTAAFGPDASYFLVRGHFNWQKLESYAKTNGGGCYERLCHLPGSRPERRISFLPLRANVMALAVSADDLAAARLRDIHVRDVHAIEFAAPADPVWVSIPATALKQTASMAPGARLFAAAMTGADRVTLTFGAKDRGDYLAKLEAVCGSAKTARDIVAQLVKVTAALKDARSKNADGLAGLLTAGTFEQSSNKVKGVWPVSKSLVESLAGGI